MQVASAPGLLTVFFAAGRSRDFAGAQACDLDAHARLVPGAARAAASTRRLRSSRPGSRRSPTPRSTSSAPSRPRRPLPFAELMSAAAGPPPRRRSRACASCCATRAG